MALSLGLAEIALRNAGWEPWQVTAATIQVEPGGRMFAVDPELGYTHIAGQYRVELPTGFAFGVTHDADTLRLTGPATEVTGQPEIWLLGCSFTHGWSLDDEQSYPWLLQQRMPDFQIVNFGVSGYGTVQSLIQMQRALDSGRRPAAIILAYAHFHEVRNTFVRKRRKQVAPRNYLGALDHPRARLAPDGTLQIEVVRVAYDAFPLQRRSALVHAIEMLYNDFEAWQARSQDVTLALIERTAAVAGQAGIPFAVAGITDSRHTGEMLARAQNRRIQTVDISTDLDREGYTNKPHDPHPSALATQIYAAKLGAYLREGPLLQ